MEIKNLKFRLNQLMGDTKFILLEVKEKTVWADGKPTDAKISVATVTTAQSMFEKIDVKLASPPTFAITSETLRERVETLNFVYVTFVNDEATLYRDYATNKNKISARADSILLADVDIEL